LRLPRYQAALIDGTLMTLGAIYVVFFAHNFLVQFEGFLITLGVPVGAWLGAFLADLMLRRTDYAERDLYDRRGRYGDVRAVPLVLIVLASVIGFGLVTNTSAHWLTWQGYLLGPFGLGGKTGAWAGADLGVVAAILIGFVGTLFTRGQIRAQEALGAADAPAGTATVSPTVAGAR
jgi:purine-cytosine permease-like protein